MGSSSRLTSFAVSTSLANSGLFVLGESTALVQSVPAILALALSAAVVDGHCSNPKLRVRGLRSLLDKVLEQRDAARKVRAEAFIRDDAGLHRIQRGAPDPSKQEANLGPWVDTHVSMGHQGLKDKVLVEVHQCVLLKGPLTLLAMVLNRFEHGLSFTSHITNVVWPKVVRVQ